MLTKINLLAMLESKPHMINMNMMKEIIQREGSDCKKSIQKLTKIHLLAMLESNPHMINKNMMKCLKI